MNNNLRYPPKELFINTKFFTNDILNKLNITKDELFDNFDEGSFELPKKKFDEFEKGISVDEKPYIRQKISRKTLSITGDFCKGKSKFLGSGFDAGHIIAHQLVGNTTFNTRRNNLKNIYRQTRWSNKGNIPRRKDKSSKWGKNQTYYEYIIKFYIDKNPSVELWYDAELIYNRNEEIPRGIVLTATKVGESESCLRVFIPNVEKNYILNYNNIEREKYNNERI